MKKYDHSITLSFTGDQFIQLKEMAAARKCSVSHVVRDLLCDGKHTPPDAPPREVPVRLFLADGSELDAVYRDKTWFPEPASDVMFWRYA